MNNNYDQNYMSIKECPRIRANTVSQLTLEILIGLILNILISYFILPNFIKKDTKHYNINEIYLAIYIGLMLSMIEIVIIFIWVMLFL